jgi:Na+-transporting methylmalonyl-CoA/oxaloacetate decarboxylase gamma subunit
MSFLGKTLVVLHLVLSVLFMAFAGAVYTSQTNWRTAHGNLKKQLEQAQQKANTDLGALQTQLDQLQQKFAQTQNDKTTLEGQVNTLRDDNARLDGDNKQLKVEIDTLRTSSQLASQEAEERKEESKVQRARNADLNASRDALVVELNTEKDKTFALELQIAQMKEQHEKVLKDNAIMRAFLASRDLPVDTRMMTVASAPPPPLVGKILEARQEGKGNRVYVEVSLGQDDGLIAGHTMTVYRGDKYKGKIRLEDVRPVRSVGVVVETAPNSKIEKDDHVTTKL